jgi:hypothetical protein
MGELPPYTQERLESNVFGNRWRKTMTYAEIYQIVNGLIPFHLQEKYNHLCYGEMAEVEELSQWAEGLRWAEAQWEKIASQEESISIDERMQGG